MLPLRDDSRTINVWWFGARGDGTVQRTAIQAALNLAASRGKGAVYIPSGLYLIDVPLIVSSNVRVYGDGIGATILRSTGTLPNNPQKGTEVYAMLAAVTESHVIVEHMTIDHQTNAAAANGIIFVPETAYTGNPCTDCVVQNVEVLGFDTHEYLIWSMRGQRMKIVDNFLDGYSTAFPSVTGQEGIEAFGGQDVLISGNTIRRISNAGVNIGSAIGYDNTECVDIRVVNNRIADSQYGVYAGTSNGAPEGPQDITRLLIGGNQISNMAADGIRVTTTIAGTTLTSIEITDNEITTTVEAGIQLYGIVGETTTHEGVVLRGNIIRNSQNVLIGGITVFLLNGITIQENTILDGLGYGMWLSVTPDILVQGNNIVGVQRGGVGLTQCDRHVVNDNRFHRHNIAGGFSAILASDCDWGLIERNSFYSTNLTDSQVIVASNCTNVILRKNDVLFNPTPGSAMFGNSGAYPNSQTHTHQEFFLNLQAATFTGVHAAYAGNAANTFPGPFSNPVVPRNALASFQAGWDGGDITITGTDQFGRVIQETLLSNPGTFREGIKLFATFTAATKSAIGATANTVSLGWANKVGFKDLPNSSAAFCWINTLALAPTFETVSIDLTYGGWQASTTAPDGARDYLIFYSVSE